ncbi:MAG: hypothetical protein WB714_35130 [Candidatus Sulfotelmatobacter sp.]
MQKKGCDAGLGVGPLGGGDGAGAITVTATAVLHYRLPSVRGQRIVAVVNPLAEAAGMRRRGSNRERAGRKTSQEREQQQKSGGQAVHGPRGDPSPKCG